jgi:peptide/nickel transport system ATP-binding protein/oligopeptide transport system ATP-binding protein
MNAAVLDVSDLKIHFVSGEGIIRAVDGVDLVVNENETVALVGESGCGKSLTSLALARLASGPGLSITGRIQVAGQDILELPEPELRKLRGATLAYIFQDPTAALNPVKRVGDQIAEVIRLHRKVASVNDEVVRLMTLVGLPNPETRRKEYPHQFSGGMQQRIMIAMALACQPRLLVADEPTTALDVTIQAQIFTLLNTLRSELKMSVLLITHNLGLVARNASRVYVMYAGRVMEAGPVSTVLKRPAHPYTRGLLAAVPRLNRPVDRMVGIDGTVPHPARLPPGCRFNPRCPLAGDLCRSTEPGLERLEEGHDVRCHFWKQVR